MPEATYAKCDNCSTVFQYADGDFARIPALFQRIEAGGEVPTAECPQCQALAYVVRPADQAVYIIETGWSCQRRVGELIILVHAEKRDFQVDFAAVIREAQQFVDGTSDDGWTYDDNIIPRLLEKGYQLARFQVVVGE